MQITKFIASKSKNFWMIELSSSLNFIASSITSIFIPIIMLNIGFNLKDVILYYIIFHFFDIIFNLFSKRILENKGERFSYILGTLFAIGFFVSYIFLNDRNWLILSLMAIFAALYDSIYYIAFYYGVMSSTKEISKSKENNIIINIISTLAWFIGPLIGALIILFTENKNILLSTTILFFIFSLIPLKKYKSNKKLIKDKLNFKKYFKDIRNRKNFTSWGLYKISETADSILFPVFIYLIFKELDSVAYISIIAIFTSLVFTFISGNISQEKREKVIILGSISLIFIWMGRLLIDNEIYLYSSVALIGIFSLFIRMPIDTNIFKHGKEINELHTAFYKNFISMGSKMIFYILIFILLNWLNLKETFWMVPIFLILIIITNLVYLWKKKN